MKKINIAILIIYLFFMLYIGLFNWEVFTLVLKTDIGFNEINLPLVASVFLWGLAYLLLQMLVYSLWSKQLRHSKEKAIVELDALRLSLKNINLEKLDNIQMMVSEINNKMKAGDHIKNENDIVKLEQA